jgi:Uma2 family endonuclease
MTPTTITPLAAPPFTPANGTPHTKPTAPTSWKPKRWTLTEYHKLGATGIFGDLKVMLIHGEIFVMAPPAPPHNTSLGLAAEYLRMACPPGHHVRNQMPLNVETDTDPLPDLAVVLGSIRDYATRQATAAVLVVEVSDSTLFIDLTEKAELYATAKVPEYWVIDIPNRQMHVFSNPVELPTGLGATAYRKHVVYAESETVSPQAAPSATIRVSELLP